MWGSVQCVGHTGLPQLTVACAFPVYTAQAPGLSAGVLSKAGPAFRALCRSQLLRFRFSGPHKGQTQLGVYFVPCPNSSGDQVPGEHAVPVVCVLITSPVPAIQFPESACSGMLCLPWGADFKAVTLLADVSCPGSQEDLVSNWSQLTVWLRMPSLRSRLPLAFQLWLRPPPSLPPVGREASRQPAISPLVLVQSFVLCVAQAVP